MPEARSAAAGGATPKDAAGGGQRASDPRRAPRQTARRSHAVPPRHNARRKDMAGSHSLSCRASYVHVLRCRAMAVKASSRLSPAAPTESGPDLSNCFPSPPGTINSLRMRWDRLCAWLSDKRPDVLCLQRNQDAGCRLPDAGTARSGLSRRRARAENLQRRRHFEPRRARQSRSGQVRHARRRPRCGVTADCRDDSGARCARRIGLCPKRPKSSGLTNTNTSCAGWLASAVTSIANATRRSRLCCVAITTLPPADSDVHDPDVWRDTVICHPSARDALGRILDFRSYRHPAPLSARRKNFHLLGLSRPLLPKNLGIRIDHILPTSVLADRCQKSEVDRQARKGEKPSDHAPVIAWFRREPK